MTMDPNITSVSEWRLSFITAKIVHIAHRAGALSFAEHVHRGIMPWMVQCVAALGLTDHRIVVMRGVGGKRGDRLLGKCHVSTQRGIPSWIGYSWQLTLADLATSECVESSLRADVLLIRYVLLHELLHVCFPRRQEEWIKHRLQEVMHLARL